MHYKARRERASMPEAILSTNRGTVHQLVRLIDAARFKIDLVMYILEGQGEYGQLVATALGRAHARGVVVRVVASLSKLYKRRSTNRGFHVFLETIHATDDTYIEARQWRHLLFNNVHTKICIVDHGHVVVSSGNMERESSDCDWGETSLTVMYAPRTARDALEHFELVWQQSRRVQIPMHEFPLSQRVPAHRDRYESQQRSTVNNVKFIYQMPSAWLNRGYFTKIKTTILKIINEARTSIVLCSPNINDYDIVSALYDARQLRNVDVRALVSLGHNREAMQRLGLVPNYEVVMGTEDVIDWRSATGYEPQICKNTTLGKVNHSKFIAADGQTAVVGSYNFDFLSANGSGEAVFYIPHDPAFVGKQLLPVFERFWTNASRI